MFYLRRLKILITLVGVITIVMVSLYISQKIDHMYHSQAQILRKASLQNNIPLTVYDKQQNVLCAKARKEVKLYVNGELLDVMKVVEGDERYHCFLLRDRYLEADLAYLIYWGTDQVQYGVFIRVPHHLPQIQDKIVYFIDPSGYYRRADASYICNQYLRMLDKGRCHEQSFDIELTQ